MVTRRHPICLGHDSRTPPRLLALAGDLVTPAVAALSPARPTLAPHPPSSALASVELGARMTTPRARGGRILTGWRSAGFQGSASLRPWNAVSSTTSEGLGYFATTPTVISAASFAPSDDREGTRYSRRHIQPPHGQPAQDPTNIPCCNITGTESRHGDPSYPPARLSEGGIGARA